jgi:hypothetical protein
VGLNEALPHAPRRLRRAILWAGPAGFKGLT